MEKQWYNNSTNNGASKCDMCMYQCTGVSQKYLLEFIRKRTIHVTYEFDRVLYRVWVSTEVQILFQY